MLLNLTGGYLTRWRDPFRHILRHPVGDWAACRRADHEPIKFTKRGIQLIVTTGQGLDVVTDDSDCLAFWVMVREGHPTSGVSGRYPHVGYGHDERTSCSPVDALVVVQEPV